VLDRAAAGPRIRRVVSTSIASFVNDSLGHLIGDELLVGVSRRMAACMRQGDAIARLVMSPPFAERPQRHDPGDRDCRSHPPGCAPRFRLAARVVTGSIGIAPAQPAISSRTRYARRRHGDALAKARGKARTAFDASMHARAVERLRLRRSAEGDRCGEFVLHYQPVVA
jgi:predicted signal transduction protein with EAL and GGDEF domain